MKSTDPSSEAYRWDFRIVRPVFLSGDEQAVLKALEPSILIHEVQHTLIGVVGLAFEDDVRHTVFSAVTLPATPHKTPSLTLLRWPTPAFVRMLKGGTPDRAHIRVQGITGQRHQSRPIVENSGNLVGVAIELKDIPDLERS